MDLGTTYCSAAVVGEGRAETVPLGNRAAVVPSVVFVAEDGTWLTGEAAEGRALTQPRRVVREFKRRVGDPRPIAVGGVELSAEAADGPPTPADPRHGGRPSGRPAASGSRSPTRPTGAPPGGRRCSAPSPGTGSAEIVTVTEPEAAAIHYAATDRIDPSQVVAVYDLGGGTFDAALLRRTDVDDVGSDRGFEVIGRPEGIDRLGGVDFDAAVLAHVNRFLDGALDTLDLADPSAAAGLQRLRADCVEAKEALSSETDAAIPVMLPGLQTEVRMTRGEFEAMIRPALIDTVGALRRAMRAAGVSPSDVAAVLLVGGSSRIPLVAQLVGAELGRPVAVDAHPKHAVALGAALAAAAADRTPTTPRPAGGAVAPAAARRCRRRRRRCRRRGTASGAASGRRRGDRRPRPAPISLADRESDEAAPAAAGTRG